MRLWPCSVLLSRRPGGGHTRRARVGVPSTGGRKRAADLSTCGQWNAPEPRPHWAHVSNRGGRMRKKVWVPLALGLLLLLLLPATSLANANDLKAAIDGKLEDSVGINSTWVIVAGVLVMFMQAGFAFLEIGFSRGKNAGTVVAKILTNFSIAAIMYWAVGFAFAFGGGLGHVIGTHGFF